jgi:hypothetical protein
MRSHQFHFVWHDGDSRRVEIVDYHQSWMVEGIDVMSEKNFRESNRVKSCSRNF